MDLQKLKQEYDTLKEKYSETAKELTDEISTLISERKIPIHSVRHRVKEFESFYNKIKLKNYVDPFKECTDIAGIRIICLFQDQKAPIIRLIKKHFDVKEEFEKGKDRVDQFAYSSYHVIIKKNRLPCEIQIRSILQDAWAEVEHHINYKNNGADKTLIRKVNSMAALFEIADDQFQQIHEEFLELTKQPTDLNKELTGVLLYNFCKRTFPWAWKDPEHFNDLESLGRYEKFASDLKNKRIRTLLDLKELYDKHKEEIMKDDQFRVKEVLSNPKQWPSLYNKVKATDHFYGPLVVIGILVGYL